MKYLLIVISIALLTFGFIYTQHTAWTEMLVYPFLLNHGFNLYSDLVAPYSPLFLWFLQGFMGIFGYTPQTSLGLTLLLGMINVSVVYIVSLKIWKDQVKALAGTAFYCLWFFYFEGNGLWFEIAQTPFILGSFYFLYRYLFQDRSYKDIFWAGILIGLAYFMKQSVLWLILVSLLWIIVSEVGQWKRLIKSLLVFITPWLVLLLLTSLILWLQGTIADYYWWSFYYTYFIFPFIPGHKDYPSFAQLTKLVIPFLVLFPMLAQMFKTPKKITFFLSIVTASFMFALPRWGLFHLQPLLALVSVISGGYWLQISKQKRLKWVGILIVLLWVVVVARQEQRFFQKPIRFFEPSVYAIAQDLEKLGVRAYVSINGPDQLYTIMQTTPEVKPYVQNFAWYLEVNDMQARLVNGLIESQPQYLLYTPTDIAGVTEVGQYRPRLLAAYIETNYSLKERLGEVWVWERLGANLSKK